MVKASTTSITINLELADQIDKIIETDTVKYRSRVDVIKEAIKRLQQ